MQSLKILTGQGNKYYKKLSMNSATFILFD